MKKTIVTVFALCVMSTPALALEPLPDMMTGSSLATAYQAGEMVDVLKAYGVPMDDDGAALSSLATAYKPAKLHEILTGYGLVISPEEVVAQDLAGIAYARMVDDEVVLNNTTSVAYKAGEFQRVMAAYKLPMMDGDSDGDGVPDSIDQCPDTPKGVQVDERGCWSVHAPFLFAFDSADIKPEAADVLNKGAMVFDENPELKVKIDGYTDSTGPEAYNMMLSERRAKAVKMYLVEKGVDSTRISVEGYGESNPAYSNETEEGRAKNRRVEYTIMK